jgi:glycosyltransferase involved in cell wall biosynthesis
LAFAVLEDGADELVIVVDGCRDGSIELLRALAAQDSRLRPVFVENGGEGRARQIGAQTATGDILVVLDDDVIPQPGLINGYRKHFEGSSYVR